MLGRWHQLSVVSELLAYNVASTLQHFRLTSLPYMAKQGMYVDSLSVNKPVHLAVILIW